MKTLSKSIITAVKENLNSPTKRKQVLDMETNREAWQELAAILYYELNLSELDTDYIRSYGGNVKEVTKNYLEGITSPFLKGEILKLCR